MTRTEIEDKVAAVVEPLLQGTTVELVDVEYVQEKDWYLRIFIDKPGGVGIDDCEQLSRTIEPVLDELDFLRHAYYLEVSSPGLDRVLRRDRDFARYAGQEVEVRFFRPQAGLKQITATLKGLQEGMVAVVLNGGERLYSREDVAQVRLHVSIGQSKK